jgi:hypothetical protein
VEKALPQVVPSITAEAARQLFHESRLRGVATVIVAVKVRAVTPVSFSACPGRRTFVSFHLELQLELAPAGRQRVGMKVLFINSSGEKIYRFD